MSTLKEVFQKAVAQAIGEDKNHGWGVDDSFEVIDTLIAEQADEIAANKGASEALMAAIKEVINPSQFRQKLESAKILNKSASRAEKVDSLLSDFKG